MLPDWQKHLLIAVGLALFFPGKPVFLVFYVMLALVFGANRWLRRAPHRLHLRRTVDDGRLFPDDTTVVRLQLTNRGRLSSPWLVLDVGDHGKCTVAPPRFIGLLQSYETIEVEYEMRPRARGVVSMPPVSLEMTDPLGIQRVHATRTPDDDADDVLVYPRVHPMPYFRFAAPTMADGTGRFGRGQADPLYVVGVRDYVSGESLRHVHWKATAHVGTLQVKTFDIRRPVDVTVIVDLDLKGYPSWNGHGGSELAIEAAASVLHAVVGQGGWVALTIINDEVTHLPRHKGAGHLNAALEMLARVNPVGHGADFSDVWREYMGQPSGLRHHRPPSGTYVIITPRAKQVAKALATPVYGRSDRRYIIMHVDEGSSTPLTFPLPAGMAYYRVTHAADLPHMGKTTQVG